MARFRAALERKNYTLYPGSGPGDWWTYCPGHEVDGLHDPSLHVSVMREGTETEDVTAWCFKCEETFFLDLLYGRVDDCTAVYFVKPQDRMGKVHGHGAVITEWQVYNEDSYVKWCNQVEFEERGGLHVIASWDYNAGEFRKVKWSNGEYVWLRRSDSVDGSYASGLNHRSNEVELYGVHRIDETVETVWLCEGEKDADTLYGLGLVGVSYHTVGDRTEKYGKFAGLNVVVLCDNDRKGLDNSARVVEELQQYGRTRSIKMLAPFDGKSGYDVSDWVADGGTRDALVRIAADVESVEVAEGASSTDGAGDWLDTVDTTPVGAGDDEVIDPKRAKRVKDILQNIEDREEAQRIHRAGQWVVPPDDVSYTMDVGFTKQFEPRPSYIAGLLYERNIVTITGAPKIGKTTLTGNIVRCLVDEVPFLGEFETQRPERRVGMWNGEMDEEDYVNYLRAMNIRNPGKLAACNLRGRNIPLLDKAPLKWTIEWLEKYDIEVWVVDPWAKVLTWCGVDEKDNTGIAKIQGVFEDIQARTGVSTIIIPTHPSKAEGKESSDPTTRGGSVMEGWPDSLWKYVRSGGGAGVDDDEERINSLYVYGRDMGMPASALTFDAATHTLSLRGRVGDAPKKVVHQEIMDKALALITEQPGINQTAICDAIGGKKINVTDALKTLENDGLVVFDTRGRSKHYTAASGLPDWPAAGLGTVG